jgi:hypothetical protein
VILIPMILDKGLRQSVALLNAPEILFFSKNDGQESTVAVCFLISPSGYLKFHEAPFSRDLQRSYTVF